MLSLGCNLCTLYMACSCVCRRTFLHSSTACAHSASLFNIPLNEISQLCDLSSVVQQHWALPVGRAGTTFLPGSYQQLCKWGREWIRPHTPGTRTLLEKEDSLFSFFFVVIYFVTGDFFLYFNILTIVVAVAQAWYAAFCAVRYTHCTLFSVQLCCMGHETVYIL